MALTFGSNIWKLENISNFIPIFLMHMKKSFLIISFFSLIVLSSFTLNLPTTTHNSGSQGKFKSIRETRFSILKSDSLIQNQTTISDKYSLYDTMNNIIKTFQYKSDTLFSYTTYTYNDDNRLIRSDEFNSDGSLYLSITYAIDSKGFIIQAIYHRTTQKRYDRERNTVDVEFYKYYKDLFAFITFINDFKGNVLEKKYFTSDNNLAFSYNFKYDYKYNATEIKYYNSHQSVSWRKKNKYNTDNNMIESTLYLNNRIALRSKFEYVLDNNSNWVKQIEKRKLFDNFYADDITDNTIITIRKIEYY